MAKFAVVNGTNNLIAGSDECTLFEFMMDMGVCFNEFLLIFTPLTIALVHLFVCLLESQGVAIYNNTTVYRGVGACALSSVFLGVRPTCSSGCVYILIRWLDLSLDSIMALIVEIIVLVSVCVVFVHVVTLVILYIFRICLIDPILIK